jgi:hypothetical protein
MDIEERIQTAVHFGTYVPTQRVTSPLAAHIMALLRREDFISAEIGAECQDEFEALRLCPLIDDYLERELND